MTNKFTPRQISTYIKKELLKKYPGITQLTVQNIRNLINIYYEGGCNGEEMQRYVDELQGLYYDNEANDYKSKQRIITIDGSDYDLSRHFVFSHRKYNKSQAQIILDLIKGFLDANNKAVSLDLSQSSYDNGWMLAYNQDNPRQVIIDAGKGYNNTPELSQALKPDSYIFERAGGCITVQSLHDAIRRAIDF